MAFDELITRMTQAACAGDGDAVAECFTEEGVYHDVFYGSFRGADISRMITDFFHRDACSFRWDLHDLVANETTGLARYIFSFESRLRGCEGRRAVFEGVAVCRLEGTLIRNYSEVADTMTGQHMMGFSGEKMLRFIHRQTESLACREEAVHHLQ